MRNPYESVEGQSVDLPPEVDPKRRMALERRTEMSIFKPLGDQNLPLTFLLGYHSSPVGRLLATGIGGVLMMTVVFISAIVIGINDSTVDREVVVNESVMEQSWPIGFDVFSPPVLPSHAAPSEPVRSHVRSKPVQPEIRLATYKPRVKSRQAPPLRPQKFVPIQKFVPTTLVIYAQNGLIKKRIEPWLYADARRSVHKPRTYSRD